MTHVYRLRVVLDTEEDVIRDIDITGSADLVRLHETILTAFELEKGEMASFFRSNENWDQGEEISLLDFGDAQHAELLMQEVPVADAFPAIQAKMIYVYDFFSLWTFFIEAIQVTETREGPDEPVIIKVTGERPESAPHKNMEGIETGEEEAFDEDGGDSDPDNISWGEEDWDERY